MSAGNIAGAIVFTPIAVGFWVLLGWGTATDPKPLAILNCSIIAIVFTLVAIYNIARLFGAGE